MRRWTQKQYAEIIESRDWCVRNDMRALVEWYNEELANQARRRALPIGASEYRGAEDEGDDRRRNR